MICQIASTNFWKKLNRKVKFDLIYKLGDLHTKTQESTNKITLSKGGSYEFVNFEFFMKSIALISFSLKFSEDFEDIYKVITTFNNNIIKILFLVEKLSKSKGINIKQEKSGFTK